MPLLTRKEGKILAQLHRHSCCCKFSHYPPSILWISILDLFPLFLFSDMCTRSSCRRWCARGLREEEEDRCGDVAVVVRTGMVSPMLV
jgi:hypothetical protein